MAFIKNSYGELWISFTAQPKCCMCSELGVTESFGVLEDAVAHLEQNSVCMECLFDDEKKNQHSSKGKKKRD